jgi:formylmethanofuran dehydrogenase subunit E
MPKRKTQSEFIEELEKLYGIDYYDFSKVQYINAESKIIIICPKHGEIIKNANTLVRKKGSICSKCTYDKIRLTDADLIKRANKVHEYKYSYPNLNYTQ